MLDLGAVARDVMLGDALIVPTMVIFRFPSTLMAQRKAGIFPDKPVLVATIESCVLPAARQQPSPSERSALSR